MQRRGVASVGVDAEVGAPVQWRMAAAQQWRWCPLCRSALADRPLDGAPRRYCAACGFVFWEHALPAAAAVVADDRGRLLYVRRRYPPEVGGWCLPGGFADKGETAEAAACREVREETGLEVQPVRQLGVFGSFIAFIAAQPIGGTLAPGPDVCDAVWFASADAPTLCFPSHRSALEVWRGGADPPAPPREGPPR